MMAATHAARTTFFMGSVGPCEAGCLTHSGNDAFSESFRGQPAIGGKGRQCGPEVPVRWNGRARLRHCDAALFAVAAFRLGRRGLFLRRRGDGGNAGRRRGGDRKSKRLNSSHSCATTMPSAACNKKKETIDDLRLSQLSR